MSRRWLAALPLLLACACDAPTAKSDSAERITFSWCTFATPVWLAYQNQGEPWRRVTPDAGGNFTIDAADKLTIALFWSLDVFGELVVLQLARDEIPAATCRPAIGAAVMTGSILNGGFTTGVAMGSSRTPIASDGSFEMRGLHRGPYDVVVLRYLPNGVVLERAAIRRGEQLVDGGTIDPIDLAGVESGATVTNELTITGAPDPATVGGNRPFVTQHFNARGTVIDYRAGHVFSLPHPLYHLPSPLLAPTDFHRMTVSFLGEREISYFYREPRNITDVLPGQAQAVQMTRTETPYFRPRFQVPAHPDYPSSVAFAITQCCGDRPYTSRSIVYIVTAAYLGNTASNWDVTLPDLTGAAGWDPSYGPPAAVPITGMTANLFGGRFGVHYGVPPNDGEILKRASPAFATAP